MSGIEVIGIILGAIPILLEGLETYKSGIKSVRTVLQRRTETEDLIRMLKTQEFFIQALINNVLLNSGCELPGKSSEALTGFLQQSETQTIVQEYLGLDYTAFIHMLQDCEKTFQQLLHKVAKFVPAAKRSADLSRIREMNKATKGGQPEVFARLNLMLNKKDFKEECHQLENSTATLKSFLDLVTSNRHSAAELPNKRAKRLARALRKIRNHAEDLYSAVSKGWATNCYHKHEAKLFLEDRVEQSRQSAGRNPGLPIQSFQFVFAGRLTQGYNLWHESTIQIFENVEPSMPVAPLPISSNNVRPSVNFSGLITLAVKTRDVKDICSAIEDGKNKSEHMTFTLTHECKIGETITRKNNFTACKVKEAVRLRDCLLSVPQNPGQAVPISWIAKTSLALNIASSFLQLLRTPWTEPYFSTDTITLLRASNNSPDITKPLLCVSFDSSPNALPIQAANFEVRLALLELGITLLEIWHGQTLEQHLGPNLNPRRPVERRLHAIEWLEDGTLPPYYQSAVYHCVAGAMNSIPLPKDWDDMQLWETMCESVIEPLSKLAKS